MSGSLNKVTLIGNLGRDPEIRNTSDGREIANFSVATSDTWKDKMTGEKKEKTEWHRVVVFSEGLVRVIKNYVKKGTKLYIEGQLQTRKWNDSENQERYTTEVVLQNYNSTLILLDSRSDASQGFSTDSSPAKNDSSSSSFESSDLDDEIPF
ncbi:MAG TPA: single-stranded DNA-binding protein [Candidatus Megaira endosymbiont of Nemacystus decipiens]|nr:single-stranded DNA-binding protein [Candidatus Megaera endosymbiont of Nemacystus decipiens]